MYGGVRGVPGNRAPISIIGMPGIPTNLWGASPLYENETLLERQYTKCKSKRSKY
jgi:hypothetical protein